MSDISGITEPRSTFGRRQLYEQLALLSRHGVERVESFRVESTLPGDGPDQETFLIRIPPRDPAGRLAKSPVLLQHGIFDSSCGFFAQKDFEYTLLGRLHDEGFDVWLGNSRGTRMTMPEPPLDRQATAWTAYWDKTTWRHMGEYDVPNNLAFIINKRATERCAEHPIDERVHYVGHSQGATQMLYALSKFKDLKVASFTALAPVPILTPNYLPDPLDLADFWGPWARWGVSWSRFAESIPIVGWLVRVGTVVPFWGARRYFLKYYAHLWTTILDQHSLLSGCEAIMDDTAIARALLLPTDAQESMLRTLTSSEYRRPTGTFRFDRIREITPGATPGGASIVNLKQWMHSVRGAGGSLQDHHFAGLYDPTNIRKFYPELRISFYAGTLDRLGDYQVCDEFFDSYVNTRNAAPRASSFTPVQGYAHLEFIWGMRAHIDVYGRVFDGIQ